ncbi:hypothetical protein Hanom_Chr02g00143961 [Helianthus anomalus]
MVWVAEEEDSGFMSVIEELSSFNDSLMDESRHSVVGEEEMEDGEIKDNHGNDTAETGGEVLETFQLPSENENSS